MKPKRFIVWGINYSPELTGIAPYNAALCEHLHSQSHQVRMVTSFSYYPEWRKLPEDKGVLFRTDVVRGVEVHRCWHFVPKKPSALTRIFHELTFVTFSWLKVMTLPRPDAYVVVSPPLLLGFAAWLAGLLKRAPFVFHVQDLQPDAVVSLEMMKGALLLRLLYALESFAYRKAALVSGITPGMVRAFACKGVPASRILLFPNGIELPPAGSLPSPGRFRRRFGIANDESLGIYSGNLGVKHGVEILLEAARLSQGKPIRTVICGDGARRELLERRARDMGLANVLFLPLQAEVEYHEMMVDADLYFVTQQAGSGALFFPSKLLKGLALSKAIIVVADEQSELSLAATEGRFALVVKPDHPDELAAAQERLAANKEERLALGRVGRRYVEQYELKRLLRSFESSLFGFLERSCLPISGLARPLVPGRTKPESAP
jgi:colanic acid biosynthesis glycosyl transferase WcaI